MAESRLTPEVDPDNPSKAECAEAMAAVRETMKRQPAAKAEQYHKILDVLLRKWQQADE